MKEGWKEVKLGDVIELKRGYDLPSQDRIDGIYPIISSNGVSGNHREFKVEGPGVITGRYGTIGEVFYVKDKFWPLNTSLYVKDFKGNDRRYIYYLLKVIDLKAFNAAGAVPGINRNHLHSLKLSHPPLETQRKIANILSGYDDLIENNLKRIKILEEMAQQTYEEWFVRMRFPGYETAVFDENGLPEAWEKVKLGEFLNFKKGKKVEEFLEINEEGTEKVLLLDSIESGNFKYTKIGKHELVERGDILMLMDGARSSYVFQADNGIIGSTLAKIETERIPASFMFFYFQNNLEWLQINNTGAAIPHANPKFIKSINFKLPNQKLFVDWQSFTKPILNNVWNLKDQNQRLREARNILLPRLMMGMIDVSTSSIQSAESLETKPTGAIISPLEKPKKEASKEFKESVLIACLTEKFGSEKFPLGRKRYTKLSYLFHRYSDNKVQDYLRKAAGPYNPKTKYGGPEKIALNNKYIQNWKSDNKMTGFVSAEKIEDAKTYFSNYWQISDLDWLTAEFKFKSNDELELLATVDNSLMELSKKNLEFTSANVLDIIKSEKEWEAKLERTIFSDANVEKAIGFLRGVLEYGKFE